MHDCTAVFEVVYIQYVHLGSFTQLNKTETKIKCVVLGLNLVLHPPLADQSVELGDMLGDDSLF